MKRINKIICIIMIMILVLEVSMMKIQYIVKADESYIYIATTKAIDAKIGDKVTFQPEAKDKNGEIININSEQFDVAWNFNTTGYGDNIDVKSGVDKSFTLTVEEKWLHNGARLKTEIFYSVLKKDGKNYTEIARGTYYINGIDLNKSIKKPKRVNKLKVKALSKKSLKVLWKQPKDNLIHKIQVQYSTNKKFKKAKIKNVKWWNTSTKINGLKKDTFYYVRIRAYKTYNKKQYYGQWSARKRAKTTL